MTLTNHLQAGTWSAATATPRDHPQIADFLATTARLSGRKFAADSRDIAEQFGGVYPDGATVVRDGTGRVRGYVLLNRPHGVDASEIFADFVLDPDVPPHFADDVVGATVDRFRQVSSGVPDAFLRTIIGADQQSAIDALIRRGARREADFIRTRKTLQDEDRDALSGFRVEGVTVARWPEVIERKLAEQVRQLQYDTFLEHFGNMSKTPEAWQQHIEGRSFAPDFSIAALDGSGDVVGYVLGSLFTAGVAGSEVRSGEHSVEHSAHTDYIGVAREHRRRGIAELLLRNIWLAALDRGLSLASLGTDVNNRSNAHVLYHRLGYRAVEHSSAYRIDGTIR